MSTTTVAFITITIIIATHHGEGGSGAELSNLFITARRWSPGQDWRNPGTEKHTKPGLPGEDKGAGELS